MNTLTRTFVLVAGLLPLQSGGQMPGWDMAVAQKWSQAKIVKYRAEGVHKARVAVVKGSMEAKADVTDRLTVEFTWDNKKRRVIGPVTVVDAKSEISNIKSDGTNCPPPQLNGEYEHFQSVSHTIERDQVHIKGSRTYPTARVSNYPASCSLSPVSGGREEVMQYVGGGDPAGLGGPITPGGPVVVAADRKSFTMQGPEKWMWTYTPTLVQ
jgi:hypothetical protein